MRFTIEYVNVRIPILRIRRGGQEQNLSAEKQAEEQTVPTLPSGKRVDMQSLLNVWGLSEKEEGIPRRVVMTESGLSIGLVAEENEDGQPQRILSYSGREYGGINLVAWRDTGVRMSEKAWWVLYRDTCHKDAGAFCQYWRNRIGVKSGTEGGMNDENI